MQLKYDPVDNDKFWANISQIEGYPSGEKPILQVMLIESGALFRLPEVLQRVGISKSAPLLAIMDPTPMQRGDQSLKPMVLQTLREGGWNVQSLELQPDQSGQVHTDIAHIETVKTYLKPSMAVISVGSGVVTDITKHACYLYEQETSVHIPFIVYQTANSVSAYTSNMAPVFVEGVKRTLPSRYPEALVCDLETLSDAPRAMTVAGVGDLLAVFVSLPDWYLAYKLGMDATYNAFSMELMGAVDDILSLAGSEIRRGSGEGMATLAKLISLSGLAMSLSHATTPFSGYEHVMSHILDLINEQRGLPLAQHGTQVALATLLASAAYQVFIEEFDPTRVEIARCYPPVEAMKQNIHQIFKTIDASGKAGEECWSDYHLKLKKWYRQLSQLEAFLRDWGEIKLELLKLIRSPQRLVEILKGVDSPQWFDSLDPPVSEEQARFAFFNAPLMRNRMTLGDLLIFLNWDRQALWQRIWTECRRYTVGN